MWHSPGAKIYLKVGTYLRPAQQKIWWARHQARPASFGGELSRSVYTYSFVITSSEPAEQILAQLKARLQV